MYAFFRKFYLLLMVLCLMPCTAWADTVLTSEVAVDITEKDANTARAKALASAEIDGLSLLLRKLVPEQAASTMAGLDAKKITAIVRGTEVLEEKIFTNRYKGRLLVSYSSEGIDALLGKIQQDEAVKVALPTVGSMVVIAGYEQLGQVMMWEDDNPWRAAWRITGLEYGNGEIVVPFGDISDRATVNIGNMNSLTYGALAPLAKRYGVTDVVVLLGHFKAGADMVLTVDIKRFNNQRSSNSTLTYRADVDENKETLLLRAAHSISLALLQAQHEAKINLQSKEIVVSNRQMLLVSINTLPEWTLLRTKLKAIPTVDDLQIMAMSPHQVDMVMLYRSTPEALFHAMQSKGFRIIKQPGYWVISKD